MKANSLFLSRRRGFSLIELLVVLAIMAILLTAAGPNLLQALQGSSLTRSGAMVQSNLKAAQQYALSLQNSVAVRFYQYTDPTIPGSSSSFRALQLLQVVPQVSSAGVVTSTYVPLTQVIRLPAPNIMLPSTGMTQQYSSLLAYNDVTGTSTTTPAASTDPSIPGVSYTNVNYVQFIFLPNGQTDLPLTPPSPITVPTYYVTIAAVTPATTLTTFTPKNFYTIQVDPLSGKVTTYRP